MIPTDWPKGTCGYWVNRDGSITWRVRAKRWPSTGKFVTAKDKR